MVAPQVPTAQLPFLRLDFSIIFFSCKSLCDLKRFKLSPGSDITRSQTNLKWFIILEVRAGPQAVPLT